MNCPKCGSENITIQAVTYVKNKHNGCLWWACIGWWWVFIKWLVFTLPALFVKIFGKGKGVKTTIKKQAVCQNCGHMWNV